MNNILCVKWGTLYGPEYVNILYAMVKRNLTRPFRFVCLTDDSKGISKRIETKPLRDRELRGWWSKIAFFQPPLFDIEGPCLTFDLDMVIVDNIDCFFDYRPGGFCMKWDYTDKGKKQYGHSSCVMRFNANEHAHIYEKLDLNRMDHVIHHTHKTGIKRHKYWGDQIWITKQMRGRDIKLWPKPWIRKFAKDCHRNPKTKIPVGDKPGAAKLDYSKLEFFVPEGTKVIAFSGRKQRNEKELGKIGRWWNDR
jgi:hypothetical protein